MVLKVDVDGLLEEGHKDSKELLIIIDNGDDVIFNLRSVKFEEYKGVRTSEMAVEHDGRKVLKWMLGKDFDPEALDIIAQQLRDYGTNW